MLLLAASPRFPSSPHVLLAAPYHGLIDVDHGDKLGRLLKDLMEQRPVATAQDQQLFPLVVLSKYQDYV